MSSQLHVATIGAGSWGTALAQTAATAGHKVTLIGRDPKTLDAINTDHTNPKYLPDITLSSAITATADLATCTTADIIFLVVPAQQTRAMMKQLAKFDLNDSKLILCAKGLEAKTQLRLTEIVAQECPTIQPLILSGPSFASDVANGLPTAVTIASSDLAAAQQVCQQFHTASFRPYASDDLIGVELAGALKNVMALACGAVDGAGLGRSANAAVLTRAFAEQSRIIRALGGADATLTGLAGLGDLSLTCSSSQSRNFAFGIALGQGQSLEEIVAGGAKLAEGVHTAAVALKLAQTHNISTPIIEAVNALLSGKATIATLVPHLMQRPLRTEGED